MKIIRKIALTELQTFFYSPIAWLVLIVFTIQTALSFTDMIGTFAQRQEMGYGFSRMTSFVLGQGIFMGVLEYLHLYIPLLTMGLMSRELSSGSIKLLYASPVKNYQIILGKYLSMVIYGLILVAILLVFILLALFTVKEFSMQTALSCILGTYLLLCAYAAIGLFMSSMTSYQVVAAIGTLALFSVLSGMDNVGQELDFIRDITYWLSINGRAHTFINGLICSEDVLYFLIVSALFVTLTVFRLRAVRENVGWRAATGKYAGVIAIALLLGFFTSRPAMKAFYDTTSTKENTLTPNSQEIVKQLKGGLTITTYVNLLDRFYAEGAPGSRNQDLKRFEQYTRFKPEIKMKYVYYYGHANNPRMDERYPGLSDEERVEKICLVDDLNPKRFPPVNKLKGIDPAELEAEGFRMVRLIERESGEKTFLRLFNDFQPHSGEAETSAALKRVVMKLPVVGYIQGHGERGFDRDGDRSFRYSTIDKYFRNSLINNGFDFELLTLDKPIPAEIEIVMLSDMRTALTPGEMDFLDEYIARGGNLLIFGEPRRQESMNPILERFGVRLMPGQLVMNLNNSNSPDFIEARPTPESGELAHQFGFMFQYRMVITMPGVTALDYDTDRGYKVIPLFVTPPTGHWNELQTTDFVDSIPTLNPQTGEVERAWPTVLALSREVNGKEQRIVISGDADCFANGEVGARRLGPIPGNNHYFPGGIFYWLSDYKAPIDIRRPAHPDNKFYLGLEGVKTVRFFLLYLFPGLLLAGYVALWLRRRGR